VATEVVTADVTVPPTVPVTARDAADMAQATLAAMAVADMAATTVTMASVTATAADTENGEKNNLSDRESKLLLLCTKTF